MDSVTVALGGIPSWTTIFARRGPRRRPAVPRRERPGSTCYAGPFHPGSRRVYLRTEWKVLRLHPPLSLISPPLRSLRRQGGSRLLRHHRKRSSLGYRHNLPGRRRARPQRPRLRKLAIIRKPPSTSSRPRSRKSPSGESVNAPDGPNGFARSIIGQNAIALCRGLAPLDQVYINRGMIMARAIGAPT